MAHPFWEQFIKSFFFNIVNFMAAESPWESTTESLSAVSLFGHCVDITQHSTGRTEGN